LYALDGGVMYATVKADDNKPLAAGKVREFKKDDVEQLIEYTPTADNVYIVSDAGTLAGVKNNLTKKVVMVADVDMTNETWTSIDGFAGEFYGNGYAIKGLKAPLFGTTTASVIKGVHLEDVEITKNHTSGTLNYGSLICFLNNANGVVENCSVSGSLVITGSYAAATYLGGIIGRIDTNQTISELVNKVNIDFQATNTGAGYYAGIVGGNKKSGNTMHLTNCKNLGTLTISGTIKEKAWIAGVLGYPSGSARVSNCENGSKDDETYLKGSVIYSGEHNVKNQLRIAGITLQNNISNCVNYAKICFSGASTNSSLHIAGVCSQLGTNKASLTNCENYGPIEYSGTYTGTALYIGGVCSMAGGEVTLTDCTNYGKVNVSLTTQTSGNIYAGGVISQNLGTFTLNSVNNRGEITALSTSAADENYFVGGVAGTTAKPITNASVFCNVNAQGLSNVGMLTGSAYSDAIAATGCKVGGSILMGDATEAVTLTGENYYNYIYGSGNPTEKPDASVCVYWDGTEE